MTEQPLTARSWLKTLATLERRRLYLAAFLGVLAGVQTVIIVVGVAWLVEQLIVHHQTPYQLVNVLALLALCVIGRGICQWGQEVISLEASLRIRRYARRQMLDKFWALGPVWLAYHQSGALATQAVENIEALDGYFSRFYTQQRIVLLLPLVILCVVLKLDYLVAIFLLISAPIIPLFMALVGMGAERVNRDQFAAVARLSAHFLDRVRGMATLQLFGRTQSAHRDVWWATDDYRQLSMRTLRLAFLSSAVLEFFASVAIAVVAMYVGFGLLGYIDYGPTASLTLFSGLAVLLLAPEFFQPLRTLSQHYHDRATALGAAESLVTILNESSIQRCAFIEPSNESSIAVLKNVSVEYAARGQVLGPVNLTINHGDIIAISGPSGSGKSTLLALLAGFLSPSEGVFELTPPCYAWLDQQPALLHGSLADNLRLANPEADTAEMQRALDQTGLGALLAQLPDGLETLIGERGIGLSGGQAQRLALARIYLSEANFILLDEPTASLDRDTEEAVIQAMLKWAAQGRTLIMATHHPAAIRAAKRHFELRAGRLEEVRHEA
ncbi:thiol reductant ABC exporter subunit CydD [Vreelandella populi]|uniref:Thiol reductant ABC exporter subunit CydD n=1 Tax=Vreelandella populi TaxID=2498858 RepID=A0A3S0YEY0_9GAMM|nr:thiol reductant ABC exporter subunit CydD [Halomonas populi]RUR40674.1 thiol reductant ABC exporter subunit CydD [Halomonas populi]RUR49180.1 thiol reductant ABC exporter subunit CydD [Halomonas populi]